MYYKFNCLNKLFKDKYLEKTIVKSTMTTKNVIDIKKRQQNTLKLDSFDLL